MAFIAPALAAAGAFAGANAGAIGAAGALTSAVGAIAGGEAASQNASYQAQVARMNAQIATDNAARASAAGVQQSTVESEKIAAEVGAIKAGQAANGIDVNTGSADKVQEGAREEGQLSSETALSNAELQAYGYKTQAAGFQAQSGLEEAEAAEAPIGADIGAAGGLLSNASSIGFKYANPNWSQTGSSAWAGSATNQGPELVGTG